MTLRSRLSAAWKAFIRDDFPPTSLVDGATYFKLEPHTRYQIIGTVECRECQRTLPPEKCYVGAAIDCPLHGTTRSMADEAMKIRAELEDMHSTLTPDNAEPVKLTKRPRKKLESVKK